MRSAREQRPQNPRSAWRVAGASVVGMSILPLLTLALAPAPHAPQLAPAPRVVLATAAAPARPLSTERHAVATQARPEVNAAPIAEEPASCDGVCGTALDPDGKPAAEAQIVCKRDDAVFKAAAAPNGRWSLAADAAGCQAFARKDGYADSELVTVDADRDNALRLAPAAGIEGYVVDAAGAPVPSYWLSVEAFTAPSGELPPPKAGFAHVVTAPDGRFALKDLPAGRYVLAARAEGAPLARSRAVEVDRGRTTSRVRIALARGGTLTGVVTAAGTGERLAGATVALELVPLGPPPKPVTTDASGSFTLTGVPSGAFSVRVTREGYRQKIVTALDAGSGAALTANVALTSRANGGPDLEISGSGAGLSRSSKGIVVGGLLDGGPASAAGLRKGDVVQRIDGVSTSDLMLIECIQRLRGPEGTRVSMTVERDGRPVELVITRALIVD